MMHSATAWLKLLRLPNVFTAVADVAMGYWVTHRGHELEPPLHFGMLIAISILLYLSGMVLNDVFDAAIDAREQPHRPIPTGRISLSAARVVGWGMLISGVAIAWYLSYILANDWRPGMIATLLAICVVMYDGPLKRTRLAPLLMGECRFLNVLLGMSLTLIPWDKFEVLIAAGIGIYILGITVFSRTDAYTSSRGRLVSGFMMLAAGLGVVAGVPYFTFNRPPLLISTPGWYLLWIVIALILARRCLMAILDPSPPRVQAAVRHCVQWLIVLDSAICAGYAGPSWGFAVLALIVPTIALTVWLNAT